MGAFYERCFQKQVLVENAGAPGDLRAIIGREEGRCSPGRHSTVPDTAAIGVHAPLHPMQHRLESAQKGGFSSRPEETGFPVSMAGPPDSILTMNRISLQTLHTGRSRSHLKRTDRSRQSDPLPADIVFPYFFQGSVSRLHREDERPEPSQKEAGPLH